MQDGDTFLCFDFGERRIGVAIGQVLTNTATPLTTIVNPTGGGVAWEHIAQLIQQWQPDALIVGVPLREGGQVQTMTLAARRFARRLHGRYGLPVFEADERYTSRRAQQRFREQRAAGSARRKAQCNEDAVAAQIILEDWLDANTA